MAKPDDGCDARMVEPGCRSIVPKKTTYESANLNLIEANFERSFPMMRVGMDMFHAVIFYSKFKRYAEDWRRSRSGAC